MGIEDGHGARRREGAAAARPIRVLLVEDEPLIRAGLRALIETADDLRVVAEFANADDAQADGRNDSVDVAVVCGLIPGTDLVQLAQSLQAAGCRTIIVSPDRRPARMRQFLGSGVWGFMTTGASETLFLDAVRQVAAGERVLDPTVSAAALALRPSPLTPREKEVLAAASEGLASGDVAARTCLAQGTVRNYLSSAIAKTGARNRIEAARVARANGWL